jgi:hypothetical protein
MAINLSHDLGQVLRRDPHIDRDLVLTFFENFSRAEYALKRAGYAEEWVGAVSAAWDRFADVLHPKFFATNDDALTAAVDYFFTGPPLKQTLSAGVIGWAPAEVNMPRTLRQLLIFVRRVRNNLFHGGKFPGVPHDDPARNNVLLRHGLVILLVVMSLDPDVLHHFLDEA